MQKKLDAAAQQLQEVTRLKELRAWLKKVKPSKRKCRGCGCTEASACPGGCAWLAPAWCDVCQMVEELNATVAKLPAALVGLRVEKLQRGRP